MCRYAHHRYRDHFACFDCRKAFKAWLWEDGNPTDWKTQGRFRHISRSVVCPECQKLMANMGLDFKAPPQRDIRAWQVMAALYRQGINFDGCGCYVGFRPPRNLRDVPAFLANRHQLTLGASVVNRHQPTPGASLAKRFALRS